LRSILWFSSSPEIVFTVIALFFLSCVHIWFLCPKDPRSTLSKPYRRLRGTVVSCSHHEHHYANNHYRRVSPTLRRRRLLLPPAIRTIARGELITLVEAIGFYDGLSFVPSVVRQFFKLDNLSQEFDLGSKTILTPTVVKYTPRTFDSHHKLPPV
jgi:hypothetical protein